jgi:glycine betaine/proline transport system permease protein
MAQTNSDPWSAASAPAPTDPATAHEAGSQAAQHAASTASSPWGAATVQHNDATSFLSAAPTDHVSTFSLAHPFHSSWIPLKEWVDTFVNWLVLHFRPLFTAIKTPVDATLSAINNGLNAVPPLLMILILALIAWQLAGKRLGIGTAIGMFFLGAVGIWGESMTTLSLVITSVIFCMLIGIPTGILMARNERMSRWIRPMLDTMQTTPAFVYLVPVVMLFGIGNVPGVVVTIIFAVPPVIRLTNLGIRQVPEDLIEAANSFGANPRQLLYKVQLPLAMPTILAGVNQTLMLSLSMVVIASMISVGGLGLMVLRGIGRLDIGLATVGGLGIVVLAIILDRMTQALGRDARERGTRHWYESGPIGLMLKMKKNVSK